MLLQGNKDEEFNINNNNPRQIYKMYENESSKIVAYVIQQRSTVFSPSMKKSVRPLFSLLLLVVVAATFGSRVALRTGFGSIYRDGDGGTRVWGNGFDSGLSSPVDFPIFNSTLLKLAETEVGEVKLRGEVDQLLEGNFGNPSRLRTFATWRRFFNSGDARVRTSRGFPLKSIRSPEFSRVWREFRRCLREWSRKTVFQSSVVEELVDRVKVPIDRHNGVLDGETRKYSSCAVVGNSGILLSKEYGGLIDSHEAVIRLNNARVESYQKNVGSKTSISFVNSNILHLCARRGDCFCHPYGANVPIVMYMCQPAQFLDYVVCTPSHKSPLIVTDRTFDMLCTRIVKYYSLKRFAVDGPRNKTLEMWNSVHEGSMFHYSSGMQAVTMALGICDQVSLFGFGKSTSTKHHYHTNQKKELSLHDYEAEYDFYRDLVERPHSIPFFPEKFKFPPVMIGKVIIAVSVVAGCYIYKALRPPPSKVCGTLDGPPVTSPRIKLKDGRYLAYTERGVSKDEAAYKIIVVHGFDSSKDQPLPVSQELVEELKLYFLYFDRAGYGESDPYPKRSVKSEVFDIQELADALQLGSKFYLIGISMGGYPVWSCLNYIPHRLAGVSLVVPFVHYWWPKFPRDLARKSINKLPGISFKWTFRVAHYAPWLFYLWMTQTWFPSLKTKCADPASIFSSSDFEIVEKLSQLPHTDDAQKTTRTTQQGEYESLHRDLMVGYGNWDFSPLDLNNPLEGDNKGSVHIWQGCKDKLIPIEMNRYISKQLPWIKYHEVSEGGHLLLFEQTMCDKVIRSLVLGCE